MADLVENFVAKVLEGDMQAIGIAILSIIVVYYITKVIFFRPKGKTPPAVPGLPWLGHAIEFGSDPVSLFKKGYKMYGDVFNLKLFGEDITMLTGSEGHELFFKAREDEFSACQAYRFTVPVFGREVVYDCPPDVLIEQRKMVAGALTAKRFKLYVPMMEQEANDYFTKYWGEKGEADLLLAFNEVTVLTSTRCLQGSEIREKSVEFSKLYWDLDKALSAIGFFFPNIPLPTMLGRNRARKRIGDIFNGVISKRRSNPGEEHEDMIQTFMESSYKDGRQLPDEHIISLMVALLLAGQHTSNVTGAWTGVHFLQNQEKLKKALEEQSNVVGDGDLSFEQLKECTYLDACVKETLRLRPPIIVMMRRVVKDMEFKGYTIRNGSIVAAAPALGHRLDKFYENPDAFEPERFCEREEDRKNPFSFIAFGAGKHACIGEAFAFVQVKTLWSWLLRHYELELVSKDVKPNYHSMVVAPLGPVTVRYRRIKQ